MKPLKETNKYLKGSKYEKLLDDNVRTSCGVEGVKIGKIEQLTNEQEDMKNGFLKYADYMKDAKKWQSFCKWWKEYSKYARQDLLLATRDVINAKLKEIEEKDVT